MKVRFVQSGGYAGLIKGCEVDTANLSSDEAAELERLVRESGISGSGELLSDVGRDLKQYELSIEGRTSKVSITLDDSSVPQTAEPLIAYLKKRSRPMALE
jgi:hypothetical protein